MSSPGQAFIDDLELQDFKTWLDFNVVEIKKMSQEATKPIEKELEAMLSQDRTSAGYLARSGELLSEAEYYRDKALGDATDRIAKTTDKPSLIKALGLGQIRHETRVVRLLERLNASLVHKLENLRTLISLEKERLKDDKYHKGGV